MHPLLITLHSARDDASGDRCPAEIPQLDTSQASKESHNSIHNPGGLPEGRGGGAEGQRASPCVKISMQAETV